MISEDDGSSIASLDSLDTLSELSEQEVCDDDSTYQALIGDFPVGLYVWKLIDKDNAASLTLKFANAAAEQFTYVILL